VFGRQRAAVHLIADQDIGFNTRDRKILDVGIDDNAPEFTGIRAIRPNVLSGRAWLTIGQHVGKPDATPPDVANASRRLERRERTAAALMNARHLGLWIAHQVVEPKRARALDHAVDCQRPSIPFEARNAEVAQHNDVLRARQTVPHLVRCKRITLERALRIEPHRIHSASLLVRRWRHARPSLNKHSHHWKRPTGPA
jgi:hypothetical protein